jgi:hypothetical protein
MFNVENKINIQEKYKKELLQIEKNNNICLSLQNTNKRKCLDLLFENEQIFLKIKQRL